jgi:hypothetical protein
LKRGPIFPDWGIKKQSGFENGHVGGQRLHFEALTAIGYNFIAHLNVHGHKIQNQPSDQLTLQEILPWTEISSAELLHIGLSPLSAGKNHV